MLGIWRSNTDGECEEHQKTWREDLNSNNQSPFPDTSALIKNDSQRYTKHESEVPRPYDKLTGQAMAKRSAIVISLILRSLGALTNNNEQITSVQHDKEEFLLM